MLLKNHAREVLKSGQKPCAGIWQMLPGSELSRCFADAGYDWVMLDMEHGMFDDLAMHESISAISSCSASPLVRVAANEEWMIKRALDAGAHGVSVPMLRGVEDAQKMVSYAKYPPMGIRGFGPVFAVSRSGVSARDYLLQANESLLVIAQIETHQALAEVEDIAKVDGVDVLLVGPSDLGNSIGHPIIDGVMHDELNSAIMRTLAAAKRAGKHACMYCSSGVDARTWVKKGFSMVSVTTDLPHISHTFKEEVLKLRDIDQARL